jgi:serine/threonine protein kinase
VGGFGKVMLGKHKEEKKEVAIKFMDVSENRIHIFISCLLVSSSIGKHNLRDIQRSRITEEVKP